MDWDANTRRVKVVRDFVERVRWERLRQASKPTSVNPWEVYRVRKNAWLSANPGASGDDCRAALSSMRRELGIE